MSVSEPLSSDLNVNFVCLSVCLSVCHGPSTYCKSLPALILCILRHALIQKPLETWTMDSLTPWWRQQRQRQLTDYSMARAIDITAWHSVNAICLCCVVSFPDDFSLFVPFGRMKCLACESICCLTHSACVQVTGLPPLSSHNSTKEATGSACKRRWLECCHLSIAPPWPAACAGPACVQQACIS